MAASRDLEGPRTSKGENRGRAPLQCMGRPRRAYFFSSGLALEGKQRDPKRHKAKEREERERGGLKNAMCERLIRRSTRLLTGRRFRPDDCLRLLFLPLFH